ncbi:hypothetical protein ACFOLD_05980 [Kocuria carniphila]
MDSPSRCLSSFSLHPYADSQSRLDSDAARPVRHARHRPERRRIGPAP